MQNIYSWMSKCMIFVRIMSLTQKRLQKQKLSRLERRIQISENMLRPKLINFIHVEPETYQGCKILCLSRQRLVVIGQKMLKLRLHRESCWSLLLGPGVWQLCPFWITDLVGQTKLLESSTILTLSFPSHYVCPSSCPSWQAKSVCYKTGGSAMPTKVHQPGA